MIETIQHISVIVSVIGLFAVIAIAGGYAIFKAIGIARVNLPPQALLVFGVLATVAAFYGGSKGIIKVDDPYIVDDGSYLTNDFVHVSIKKRTSMLPDSTVILVYYRHEDSTNVEDWVEFTPRLTFADFPYDYPLNNATNYDVLVGASYVPEPTVHTNGVWITRGFLIPDGTGKSAFVNTRIHVIEMGEAYTNGIFSIIGEPEK